jgi:hypothetical protein
MSDIQHIKEVLARYVRAVDHRDGDAIARLFVDDGQVEIFEGQQSPRKIGKLAGAVQVGQAVAGMMPPHQKRGWTHHTTMDHIIEIDGETAKMDAQFIVYYTLGNEKPDAGWPAGTSGAQGIVRPAEAGYYRSKLRRVNEKWLITQHQITLDLPIAF